MIGFVPAWMEGGSPAAAGCDTAGPSATSAVPTPPRDTWQGQRVRGRYDAAQTTEENRRHWANADGMSANAAHSPLVRQTLRNRSRYEVANNSYFAGLVKTMAHDLVGSGPRLQLRIPGFEKESAAIGRRWGKWCKLVNLADKLRVLHESRIVDGEGFGYLTTNPRLGWGSPQLDLRLIEADQVTSLYAPANPLEIDGMRFDRHGNVVEYTVLSVHPGARIAAPWELIRLPADDVLHWFRPSRPGQARGVPELTPALDLGAQMRRYTKAVVLAAETAAMLAGIMKTTGSPGDPTKIEPMESISLERGSLLTLPEGWEATQFKPEQPTGTYKEFKGEILNEMARCVNAPFNVITGNSSGYNYSSGRLDHLLYYRTVWVERSRIEPQIIDRIFLAWLREAMFLEGYLPDGLPPFSEWEWEWQWDGFESIDPVKDTEATARELELGLITLDEACAARGRDWRSVVEQRRVEEAVWSNTSSSRLVPSVAVEEEDRVQT